MNEYQKQLCDIWLSDHPKISIKELLKLLPSEMASVVQETAFNIPEVKNELWLNSTGLDRFLEEYDDEDEYETFSTGRARVRDVLFDLKDFLSKNNVHWECK